LFERFTKEARQVVTRAVEEARGRSDSRIGNEHLLLGVFGDDLLSHLGPGLADLRRELDRIDAEALDAVGIDPGLIGVEPPRPPTRERQRHLPFTGAAKDTLRQTLREAIALDHRHIGIEHIALALTTLPASDRATKVLRGLDIEPAALRQSLLEAMRRAS
jgi:ATP-dependent Clp protease ATP-binding subunit ClpA